jgi:diguanylate cyclase (GGDEF)-like protein/PAS domain S-box-containing protein
VKQYRPHLLVAFALAVVLLSGLHQGLHNILTDFRFRWTARGASGDVVVIAIDPPSIRQTGIWPWPREIHGELIKKLQAAKVDEIAFDVDFSSPSQLTSDSAFANALQDAGGSVILPSFRQSTHEQAERNAPIHWNRPLLMFAAHAWPALVNVEIDRDGLVRRYAYGAKADGQFMPSMAALIAGVSNAEAAPFVIDFGIRSATIPRVSYVDVLRGDAEALQKVRGRKVIIGGTALELGDQFSTPNGGVIAGPVLQALATESILQQRMLRSTSGVVSAAGCALIALAMVLLWRRTSASVRVTALIGTALAIEAAALLLQMRTPIVLDTTWFQLAIITYLLAIALHEIDVHALLGRAAERRFEHIALSLGEGVVCTDRDLKIVFWNPGAAAILGYRAEEMIGRPLDVICAPSNIGADGTAFSFRALAQALARADGGQVVEITGRTSDGRDFPLEVSLSSWEGSDGIQYGAILRDISVRTREAERIRFLAEHDLLTGLANRHTLHARLGAAVEAGKTCGHEVGVLTLAIGNLWQIQATLGHGAGDSVVSAVAKVLAAEVRPDVFLARTNGDEFVFLATGAHVRLAMDALAQRISAALQAPLQVATRTHRVRVSMGGAIYPADGGSADELLGNSHLALDRARATSQSGCVFFEAGLRKSAESRLQLEAELMHATERNEFELFYQPQVSLRDGEVVGAEALIRWRHPERGLVLPGEFIPIINRSPVFDHVADWVLRTACAQARAWELMGHRIRVGVNLSPSQLQAASLGADVAEILAKTGLTPSLLELEVTEDILLTDSNAENAIAALEAIRGLGVKVVFDDFGTGYGSLSDLKRFAVDGLKIDRSFVRELTTDAMDAAIVGTIVGLGKQLDLAIIAEGIESAASAELLLRMGCDEGQGYHFGRPMPVKEFNEMFLREREAATAA